MEVIDVYRQHSYAMSLGRFAGMWRERGGTRGRVYNVISLEFSATKLEEMISPPREIQQLSWVERWWTAGDHGHIELHAEHDKLKPQVLYFCLMGMGGSFTDFHIDFGGSSVWYNVLWGKKVFYLVEPSASNLRAFVEWHKSERRSERFFGDEVECRRVELEPGQTLMIPSGWIHAVYTPTDSLVFGGNFLHSLHIPMQLRVHEMEEEMGVGERYRFPSFELCAWYALQEVLHTLKNAVESGDLCEPRTMDSARALLHTLQEWLRVDKKKYTNASKSGGLTYFKFIRELGKAISDQEEAGRARRPGRKRKAAKRPHTLRIKLLPGKAEAPEPRRRKPASPRALKLKLPVPAKEEEEPLPDTSNLPELARVPTGPHAEWCGCRKEEKEDSSAESGEESKPRIGFSLLELQRRASGVEGAQDPVPEGEPPSPPPKSEEGEVLAKLRVKPVRLGLEEALPSGLEGLGLGAMFSQPSRVSGRTLKPSKWVEEALQVQAVAKGATLVYSKKVEKVEPAPPQPSKTEEEEEVVEGSESSGFSLLSLATSAKRSTPSLVSSAAPIHSLSLSTPSNKVKEKKKPGTVKQRLASKLGMSRYR